MNYKELELFLIKNNIKNWNLNKRGLIDVDGNVDLRREQCKKIPFKFGEINGTFKCSMIGLTTLIGSPEFVNGSFISNSNNLNDLTGSPKFIGESFIVVGSDLNSLFGGPEIVKAHFNVRKNNLKNLRYSPLEVGGDFDCTSNNLTSLVGATEVIGGFFDCDRNYIESLVGGPKKVNGFYSCANNLLKTFNGYPYFIGDDFYCEKNPIYGLLMFVKNRINPNIKFDDLVNEFLECSVIDNIDDKVFLRKNRLFFLASILGIDNFEKEFEDYKSELNFLTIV